MGHVLLAEALSQDTTITIGFVVALGSIIWGASRHVRGAKSERDKNRDDIDDNAKEIVKIKQARTREDLPMKVDRLERPRRDASGPSPKASR